MTSDSTIYETQRGQTSKVSRPAQIAVRACAGLVIGGSVWICLTLLGVGSIVNVSRMTLLAPFAIVGALLAQTRFRSVLAIFSAGVFVFLLVVAYVPFVAGPARSLIRTDPLPISVDAVVVLSAGVTRDGFLAQQGLDRLLTGLALVHRGVAPTLVLTREKRDVDHRAITTGGDQDSLASLVGVTNIIRTPLEASTHDEAMAVTKIARASGWKSIVLVTSPFHTRRACATFEHAGLTVSCRPADSRDIAVKSLDFPDERIEAFGMWLYETAATLQYRSKGWI